MKSRVSHHLRAVALSTFALYTFGMIDAVRAIPTAFDDEAVERGGELVAPQAPPSRALPPLPQRAGERLGRTDGHVGELVTETDEELARRKPDGDERSAVVAFYPSYYHLKGNGHMALPSRDHFVCALHKLQGIMETNALVRVRYFDDGTQELGNLDGYAAFLSNAACVPKGKFFNHSQTPISEIFHTKYSFVENGSTWYHEEWGNAAAMLTGIGGPFRGLGDRAWVWQEPPNARNVVDITSDGPGPIIGYSTAFWFNESTGPQKAITFIGPGGTGTAAQAGEYFVGQSAIGSQYVSMAPVDKAFCYLTGVNGAFSHATDRVGIYLDPYAYRYVLGVSKSNNDAIHAYARCMAFDQR